VLICWLEKLVLAKFKCMCKKLLICWFARLSRLSKAKNFNRWIFCVLICWLEKLVLVKLSVCAKSCWFVDMPDFLYFPKPKISKGEFLLVLICWLEKLVLVKVKYMCKKLLICWFARLSKLSKAKNFNRWIFVCVDMLIKETSPW